MSGHTEYPQALEDVIARAERGKDEDWEFIDTVLPDLVKHSSAINFARKVGLTDGQSENLLDLACSIFELYHGPLTSQDHHLLKQTKRLHSHKPAGFRAAFALFKHGVHDEGVMQALQRAKESKDPVIKKRATELLEQHEKELQKKAAKP